LVVSFCSKQPFLLPVYIARVHFLSLFTLYCTERNVFYGLSAEIDCRFLPFCLLHFWLQSGSGFGIPLHGRGLIHLPAGIPEILNGAVDAFLLKG
jgi:hypothetical protein